MPDDYFPTEGQYLRDMRRHELQQREAIWAGIQARLRARRRETADISSGRLATEIPGTGPRAISCCGEWQPIEPGPDYRLAWRCTGCGQKVCRWK